MLRKQLGTIIDRYLYLSKLIPPVESWHDPVAVHDAQTILDLLDSCWSEIEAMLTAHD